MGIRTLDERHRRFAEEVIRGTPMTKIAEMVGVTRQTLYGWKEDALWQAYFEELARDVENARRERLTPAIEAALGLLVEQIAHHRTQLEGGTSTDLPSIKTVADVLATLVDKQRLEGGKPTAISRAERGDSPEPGKKDAQLHGALGKMFPSLAALRPPGDGGTEH